MNAKEVIEGLRCETCNASYSKKPVYDWESELYVYSDLSAATRVFCEDHHSFEDGKPYYGAKSITEILKEMQK